MTSYIIRGRDINSGCYVYWSNDHGWTTEVAYRTYFTYQEYQDLRLPNAGNEVENIQWVLVS
jgi:hypothetical protein